MYIHNIPKYMAFYFACQMALKSATNIVMFYGKIHIIEILMAV